MTRLWIARRLDKAARGNLGDIKALGDSLYEMREYFGPPWRMYSVKRGDVLIIMLGGGSKDTQRSDIAVAKQRAALLED